LCRCNGRDHEHTNRVSRNRLHAHRATDSPRGGRRKEDGYAEPCSDYSDLREALMHLYRLCGIDIPQDPQMSLEAD